MYFWELDSWPHFTWNANKLIDPISEAMYDRGRSHILMSSIGFDEQLETELKAMSLDVIKTSEIEGEYLNPESVRSSIARHLGLPQGGLRSADREVEGVVEIMLDVTRNYATPLSDERIFGWHGALFPTGRSGLSKIDVGIWRRDIDGPMQVVSGGAGRTKVHYEAPPAERLDAEMERFIRWFNASSGTTNGLLRSAIAHLWFVSVHPLDDGNGRTGRAVADLAIAQMEKSGQRFYSMSSQIEKDKKTYYDLLEQTQKGELDITDWVAWFARCYQRAILDAERVTKLAVEKAKFLTAVDMNATMSPRQIKIVKRLLDGFEGNLTAKRYANMASCSPDTASRDINDLVAKGILVKNEGGSKNTSFSLGKVVPQQEATSAPAVSGPSFK